MKNFILLSLMSLALFSLTACNTDGPAAEGEAQVSEATVYPTMMGTELAVDCAGGEDWVCTTSEYGTMSISTKEPYVGMIQVMETYAQVNTLDSQIAATMAMEGWEDAEEVERYELNGQQVGAIKVAVPSKTKWFMVWEVEGKTDYSVKCEATINSDQYEAQKENIEAICSSVRVK